MKVRTTVRDDFTPRIAQLRGLARAAILQGAREYVGKGPGGVTGGTGGSSGANYFGRRFTKANTHGFAPLSNTPRFIAVKRNRDGRWVAFTADGYATWKRKHFGIKPILVASGAMVRDLRTGARVSLLNGNVAAAMFRLSRIAEYHYRGMGNNPRRDPVTPNDADRAAYRLRVRAMFGALLARWRAKQSTTV